MAGDEGRVRLQHPKDVWGKLKKGGVVEIKGKGKRGNLVTKQKEKSRGGEGGKKREEKRHRGKNVDKLGKLRRPEMPQEEEKRAKHEKRQIGRRDQGKGEKERRAMSTNKTREPAPALGPRVNRFRVEPGGKKKGAKWDGIK